MVNLLKEAEYFARVRLCPRTGTTIRINERAPLGALKSLLLFDLLGQCLVHLGIFLGRWLLLVHLLVSLLKSRLLLRGHALHKLGILLLIGLLRHLSATTSRAHSYIPFLLFMALKSAPVILFFGAAAPAIFFCFGESFLPFGPLPYPASPFFLPQPHDMHIISSHLSCP